MLPIESTHSPVARAAISPLIPLLLALSMALGACGGGGDQATNATHDTEQDSVQADSAAPSPASSQYPVAPRSSAVALSTPSSPSANTNTNTDTVRSDVAAWLDTLTATDPQRTTLFEAARAMQAILVVHPGRRSDLQVVVDALAQAQACMRIRYPGDEEIWKTLEAHTFDTSLRRARNELFRIASQLFAEPPSNVACQTPPGGGGAPGSDVPLPPPPPPTSPPLAGEIARLEQQGVLPVLDRGSDIRGPDVDDNGIRDDVDKYIAGLSLTDVQKRAAQQTARVEQHKLLADLGDKAMLARLSAASMAATSCLGDTFEPDRQQSYKVSAKIEAITANTPERAKRAIQYMAAVSGSITSYPDGNACE